MMNIKDAKLFGLIVVALFIAGCSSSSSESTDNSSTTPASEVNVAAAANGSSVSSTFSGNETFTTDGDTTTSGFWSGGADGDEVKVTFDKSYSISSIKLLTNNTSYSFSGGVVAKGFRVYISNDDVTYTEVGMYYFSSAPVTCKSTSIGSGKIECVLTKQQDVRYIRVAVTSDFATTKLYEVEVMGS